MNSSQPVARSSRNLDGDASQLADTPGYSRLVNEEIFGPILSIRPVNDIDTLHRCDQRRAPTVST